MPVNVEAFVRRALKVVTPVEVMVRGFAELLVTAAPKVMVGATNDAGPAGALKVIGVVAGVIMLVVALARNGPEEA